ncbi:unnamed protein product [Caenorhabditis bovis]|uniref:Uncharacterized protein n=1 Tax=Caenorhabditis bovis TaxID=2654633 RepID=A0A8S1FBQ8_9PELO|nr:unnamed protein product [Caenorhabditis bovis]
MKCRFLFKLLLLFAIAFQAYDFRGLSKKKSDDVEKFQNRFSDFVDDEHVPCEMPAITTRLPPRIRAKVELIWKDSDGKGGDCWIEMARTRNILLRLTPAERTSILKETKSCKPPSVVDALPSKYQRKFKDIWKEKIGMSNCWEQQKKTRLLLLNMSVGLNKRLHPPAFDCALPHFFGRLETDLQEKLKEVWRGYKRGTSCVEQIDKQIQLLEAHEISLHSFQMPPPSMFRKRRLVKKLRRRSNVA